MLFCPPPTVRFWLWILLMWLIELLWLWWLFFEAMFAFLFVTFVDFWAFYSKIFWFSRTCLCKFSIELLWAPFCDFLVGAFFLFICFWLWWIIDMSLFCWSTRRSDDLGRFLMAVVPLFLLDYLSYGNCAVCKSPRIYLISKELWFWSCVSTRLSL